MERFVSLADENKFVSLSFWEVEEAIREWKANAHHKGVQSKGIAHYLKDFRIRVAYVEPRLRLGGSD